MSVNVHVCVRCVFVVGVCAWGGRLADPQPVSACFKPFWSDQRSSHSQPEWRKADRAMGPPSRDCAHAPPPFTWLRGGGLGPLTVFYRLKEVLRDLHGIGEVGLGRISGFLL